MPIRSQGESAIKGRHPRAQSAVHNRMSSLLQVARLGSFVALSAGILAAYELNRAVVPKERGSQLTRAYRDKLANGMLNLFGAKVLVSGNTTETEGALVIANHQSALDIAVVLSVFKPIVLSRHDVAEWPLLGRMAKHGDTIFVDRDDAQSGARAVRNIRRTLRAGRTVVAFPEGGTSGDESVRPFHPGAFAAARGLEVPIVPVGLAYRPSVRYDGGQSFGQHVAALAGIPRTQIAVNIGAPLGKVKGAREAAFVAAERVEELVVTARKALDVSRF